MTTQSFRFLHASGLQLASAIHGLCEVPDHLRDQLVEAPEKAAAAVFDAAVREDVDFVVLSGDIVDPSTAGPALITFLLRRFEELRDQRIAVYWSASKMDLAGDTLLSFDFPENVHIFPADRIERVTHFRGECPLTTLLGRSWHAQRPLRAGEYVGESRDGFQLAVLFAAGDVESSAPSAIDYWALGGPRSAHPPMAGRRQMIYSPGGPQAFHPKDDGPHGCTLVSVDGEGEIRARRIETDTVRWCREAIKLESSVTLRDARQLLRNRSEHELAAQQRTLLVAWNLTGDGRFDTPLVQRRERDELLGWLRSEFGHRSPPIWSASLEMEPPASISPDWSDDDSILGDFLRAVDERLQDKESRGDLRTLLPAGRLPSEILDAFAATERASIELAVRQAAVLGFDLLRGEEAYKRQQPLYSSRTES